MDTAADSGGSGISRGRRNRWIVAVAAALVVVVLGAWLGRGSFEHWFFLWMAAWCVALPAIGVLLIGCAWVELARRFHRSDRGGVLVVETCLQLGVVLAGFALSFPIGLAAANAEVRATREFCDLMAVRLNEHFATNGSYPASLQMVLLDGESLPAAFDRGDAHFGSSADEFWFGVSPPGSVTISEWHFNSTRRTWEWGD